MVRPDLIENYRPVVPILNDFSSRPVTVVRGEAKREPDAPIVKPKSEDLSQIREAHQREKAAGSSARQTEIERMEAEVKRLARRRDNEDSEEERKTKKTKTKSGLEDELAKYEKKRGIHRKGRKKDESDVLVALAGFRNKLQTSAVERDDERMDVSPSEAATQPMEGEVEMEVDNDRGFMGHSLQFPKGNEEEVRKAEREYEVIDPRARSAQARQEERERRAEAKKGKGGR